MRKRIRLFRFVWVNESVTFGVIWAWLIWSIWLIWTFNCLFFLNQCFRHMGYQLHKALSVQPTLQKNNVAITNWWASHCCQVSTQLWSLISFHISTASQQVHLQPTDIWPSLRLYVSLSWFLKFMLWAVICLLFISSFSVRPLGGFGSFGFMYAFTLVYMFLQRWKMYVLMISLS